ncbi:MAG: hypothetical protein JWQ96_837 [Segetibacter sp.]|nr:hypothetical protein [Segetibacter sp.]
MNKYLFVFLIGLVTVGACKQKKNLEGNEGVAIVDFMEAYPKLKLPFSVSDTNYKQRADTTTISYEVFTKFIPDTVFNSSFGNEKKLQINPIGKIIEGSEKYLTTLVSSKNKSVVFLDVFKKDTFSAHMPLLVSNNDKVINTASIDNKLSIVLNKEWGDETETMYERIILAYNNVGMFTTILTETNKPASESVAFINPLDTFPKLFKFSGDYSKGKNGFLSIRDAGKTGSYKFFVRFKNDNEEACEGEIRGELQMSSETSGAFTGNGDPCSIGFTFSSSQVKIKENGSCGNYRGIKCFFNDTFIKKKETKTAPRKTQD